MKNFTRSLIAASLVMMVAFNAYSQNVFHLANVGIGSVTPTQKLDVAGSVKFSGALMPNGVAGAPGNILLSGGASPNPPTWLGNGTSGQVLTANGSGVPTWSAAAVGTVTSVTAGTGLTATPSNPITSSGTISLANGTAVGQLFVTGATPFTPALVTVGQDAAIASTGAVTVQGIQTVPVLATPSPTTGNVLAFNGTQWQSTTGGATGNVLQWSASGVPTWASLSLTNGWALTGNSITGTNFLGTTDAEPLVFEVNNVQAGRIDLNFGVGSSLANTYLGTGSSAYGSPGGSSGDGGTLNVGIGISALGSTVPFSSIAAGGNVAVGAFAYPAATAGDWNTSVGAYSQYNATFINSSQGYNVAIGAYTMYSNSTGASSSVIGSYNIALGYQSMYGSGSPTAYGNYNTALGTYSLFNIGSGGGNTALGSSALYNTTNAGRNVGVGDSALYSNVSGEYNTALGYQANVASGNLTNATAIGYQASAPASNSITLGNSSVTSLYLPGYSTTGSIFYTAAGTGLVATLAPGISGYVLESSGASSAPVWENISGVNSVSGTAPIYVSTSSPYSASSPNIAIQGNTAGTDAGGVLYSQGSGITAVFTPTGTANYVLQSNGTAAPTWVSPTAAAGWALVGNSGTTPGTNYIGTNDDESLQFHVGGAYAGSLDPSNTSISAGNVYLGAASTNSPILPGAGNGDAGDNNVAIGLSAFASAGGPSDVGGNTGSTGGYISSDVAVGAYAMSSCIYGGGNTAIGAYSERYVSLPSANSTAGNTAAGAYSMYSNSTGVYNTALGYYSMYGNGSATAVGNYNTAEGYKSLYTAGAGEASNTAVGSNSLSNTIASRNTAVGDSALVSNTAGTNNTAIGYDADVASNNLSNATAIGYQAQAPVSNSITLGNSSVTSLYLPGYSAVGDILYTSTSGLVLALTPGASGTVLQSNGTGAAPSWVSTAIPTGVSGVAPIYSTGGLTPAISIQGEASGLDAGGVLYSQGSGVTALFTPTGTVGYVLTSNGTAAPTWQAAGTASNAWSLVGNTGTTAGTDFIGTQTGSAVDLLFKVNGVVAGSLDYTTEGNAYLGYGVGVNGATPGNGGSGDAGSLNVGVGLEAMGNIPTASHATVEEDVAIGPYAMYAATAGTLDDAVGAYSQYSSAASDNVSVGSYTLYSNTSGTGETAIGYYSMYGSGTAGAMGSKNTAVGYESLYSITTGGANTAVGSQALYGTTASKNTALGDSALFSNSSGAGNTAVGYQAMASTATGNGNVSGTYNTALGYYANVATSNLTNATAIGAYAYAAQSNSMVLGSINGVNNATANTNVCIGTNAPATDAALTIKTLHLETQAASTANTATISSAGNAGTSATASVTGTDVSGVVTINEGTGTWASGIQVTVNFVTNYTYAPTVIISPANVATATAISAYQPYVGTPSVNGATTAGFSISFVNASTASGTLLFNYFVIESQ